MPDYAILKVHAALLTPLHIGSGVNLLKDYDYAVHGDKTWRLNEAALLDMQTAEDDVVLADRLARTPPAHLLEVKDYQPGHDIFRYVIDGAPRSEAEGAQIQEQLKDINDRPYLPGTSLKGALRTAIAWYAWDQLGLKANAEQLWQRGRRPGDQPRLIDRRFASQALERDLFVQKDARRGKEPNYELLKSLQVSDSQPASAEKLMLLNVSVLNRDGSLGAPVELEALRLDTEFELTIKLDLALFSQWAQVGGLKLHGLEWLAHLPEVVQAHTHQRIQEEIAWYSQVTNARRVLTFYQTLAGYQVDANRCLLQLGWGTGWDDKTLGSRLRDNPDFMRVLLDNRRGQGYGLSRGRSHTPENFPGSRRVAIQAARSQSGQEVNTPDKPLGWALLTFSLDQAAVQLVSRVALPPLKETPKLRTPLPTASRKDRQSSEPAGPTQPARPSREAESEKPALTPQQPEREVIARFTTLPKPGDRFMGKVFNVSDEIWLEIPGLDPDDLAYAAILPEDRPGWRRFKEEEEVLCRVVGLKEEVNGYWRVRCQVE